MVGYKECPINEDFLYMSSKLTRTLSAEQTRYGYGLFLSVLAHPKEKEEQGLSKLSLLPTGSMKRQHHYDGP